MPETSVDVNSEFGSFENDVRATSTTKKRRSVHAVAKSESVQL
jgi:hypothetical protein